MKVSRLTPPSSAEPTSTSRAARRASVHTSNRGDVFCNSNRNRAELTVRYKLLPQSPSNSSRDEPREPKKAESWLLLGGGEKQERTSRANARVAKIKGSQGWRLFDEFGD